MILFIIASSTAFSWVFTFSGASQALVDTVVAMNLNSMLFCFVVAIILLIFGTFMEGTAIAVFTGSGSVADRPEHGNRCYPFWYDRMYLQRSWYYDTTCCS